MHPPPLSTIGVNAPEGFPQLPYDAVHHLVCVQEGPPDAWKSYASGWNAVAYRFITAHEHNARFLNALRDSGPTPSPEQRCLQETSLFIFFASALSVVETFCFAVNAIGAMVDPASFDVSNPEAVTPHQVQSRFIAAYGGESLTALLTSLLTDPKYKSLRKLRNVLSHRQAPARNVYVGGEDDGITRWGISNLEITLNLTADYQHWLTTTIKSLVDAALTFEEKHLGTTE